MRRSAAGNENNLLQIPQFHEGLCRYKVPVVDRIKCASQDSDFFQFLQELLIFNKKMSELFMDFVAAELNALSRR